MKQLILCLATIFAFCVTHTTAQKTNVKSPDLKLELNELRQTILKKIDDDVESTALGFSNSEAILRDLRVAYTFKTVLDTLTSTLNIISEATNIGNLKTSVMGVNSPIEYGGSMMAIHGAYKNGELLSFVFDKSRYSTSVSQMLKAADSSQPLLRFDSLRYTNSIKQSLNGVNGANIIIIPHREPQELCQTIQFRGTKPINHAPTKGLGELRRYITAEFQKLENQVAVKNYSSQQANELVGLIRAAKRSVIESKLRSTTINLTLPPSLISPNCKTASTQVSLGRIASNQTVLAAAYDSLNKNLLFEQLITVKTVGDGVVSGIQIVSKGKSGKTLQKILDVSSKASLAVDVGNLALSKVFTSKPEEIIAEKPQEMLLALPEEVTSLLLLTDTIRQVIQETETNPIEDDSSESQCVTRWTKEVDPPFRLKRAIAIKRCSTIALRIKTLSKQILGKWQLTGSKERKETLEFFADGTSRRGWYDIATRKSGSVEEVWAIVNPYGTVGSEVIQFNDEYLREVKISGATMTIISTPSSYSYEERYKRIK